MRSKAIYKGNNTKQKVKPIGHIDDNDNDDDDNNNNNNNNK